MFAPCRFCSLIPGLGVKLSMVILAGPTVLTAVGACPPHDGVRRRWRINVAPSISRMKRSLEDQSRPRPLARSILSGSPRRSMSASATRPVQHNIPLPPSIASRPHEAGLIRSWRADSLCLCLARSRNYPMLQNSRLRLRLGAHQAIEILQKFCGPVESEMVPLSAINGGSCS